MKVLRTVNLIIATGALSIVFYHLFIDSIDLSMNIITSFLVLMFLLSGIENVKEKDRDKKLGYGYIFTSLFLCSLLIIELKSIY